MTVDIHNRVQELQRRVAGLRASYNVLFQEPEGRAFVAKSLVREGLVATYGLLLEAMDAELRAWAEASGSERRCYEVVDEAPDSVDYLNALIRTAADLPLAALFRECVWDVVRERMWLDQGAGSNGAYVHSEHALVHARRLFRHGIETPADYMRFLEEQAEPPPDALPRLNPAALGSLEEDATALEFPGGRVDAEAARRVTGLIKEQDKFSEGPTYRAVGRRILPAPVGAIRAVNDFYGYKRERRFFADHFDAFAAGEATRPLLLSGLPGVGKTHLTIAHVLAANDLVLINADQGQLSQDLEWLIATLGHYRYRRFVLFFDDIDVDRVDWTMFRNQVDGFLPYSDNVAVVIASNFEFPARVRSRCKSYGFRPMDPNVCQEIVADYLERRKGIRWADDRLKTALVATIAIDYVHMFRSGRLTELTPRSLVRYFEYLDGAPARLRRLIKNSTLALIQFPTEEVFFESNELLRNQMLEERKG